MNHFKINFDELEWESTIEGARFKVFRQGDKQIRLVEFTEDFVEPDWCVKSHIGFVLEGNLEIDFKNDKVIYSAGNAIFISEGEKNPHKARALTSTVKIFLVENV